VEILRYVRFRKIVDVELDFIPNRFRRVNDIGPLWLNGFLVTLSRQSSNFFYYLHHFWWLKTLIPTTSKHIYKIYFNNVRHIKKPKEIVDL